jgi:hypothetical protein
MPCLRSGYLVDIDIDIMLAQCCMTESKSLWFREPVGIDLSDRRTEQPIWQPRALRSVIRVDGRRSTSPHKPWAQTTTTDRSTAEKKPQAVIE